MKIGTKSILFGAHCWFIHPWFVAAAWIELYGWTWDPRIWLAFFVHDLGYWGKPNMDGPEGEDHVEFGANLMHRLFDHEEIVERAFVPYSEASKMLAEGWSLDIVSEDFSENYLKVFLCRKAKPTTWRDFCLFHSRFYAERHGKPVSRLCVADKLAIAIEPWWLYLPRVWATGEAREYMNLRYNGGKYAPETDPNRSHTRSPSLREWKNEISYYCAEWAWTNRGNTYGP